MNQPILIPTYQNEFSKITAFCAGYSDTACGDAETLPVKLLLRWKHGAIKASGKSNAWLYTVQKTKRKIIYAHQRFRQRSPAMKLSSPLAKKWNRPVGQKISDSQLQMLSSLSPHYFNEAQIGWLCASLRICIDEIANALLANKEPSINACSARGKSCGLKK